MVTICIGLTYFGITRDSAKIILIHKSQPMLRKCSVLLDHKTFSNSYKNTKTKRGKHLVQIFVVNTTHKAVPHYLIQLVTDRAFRFKEII